MLSMSFIDSSPHEARDAAEARRVLRRAVELGVNFIDTDAMASRVAGSMNAFVVVRVCDASNSQNALPESREAIQPGD